MAERATRQMSQRPSAVQTPVVSNARTVVRPSKAKVPVPTPRNAGSVTVVNAYDRMHHVQEQARTSIEAGEKPVVVLFNDAAERYQPDTMGDATFIDVTGGLSGAKNVLHVTNPAFLELVHARILRLIQKGARHVIVDDASALRFYNGEGPTHAFFHSLTAAMMLSDVSCNIVLPDGPGADAYARALRTWTG